VDSRDRLHRELERIPRILLIRLRSLGDSILSLPLLEAFRLWRPDLLLDVLIEAPFAPVFALHPAVHEMLVLRPRDWKGSEGVGRMRTISKIRRRNYPAVINLHGGTTSMLMTVASGARLRIGQVNYRNPWVYNFRIPLSSTVWNRNDLHTVEHQLSLFRWLGLALPAGLRGALHIDPQARERVRQRLRDSGIDPLRYLLIQPTATLFTKQWPEANFARLADLLTEHSSLPVVLTASSHEAKTLAMIKERAKKGHHYWSDLRVEDLFALIEGCRLFVGNDSGPTHAAAALNKPVVVVWGSSNFVAWHPWGAEYELIRSNLPCMPCPGYTCHAFGNPKCILDISVDQVLESCRNLLRRTEQMTNDE
jgi:predicted lipopolysaccharide heptosyltransferase III